MTADSKKKGKIAALVFALLFLVLACCMGALFRLYFAAADRNEMLTELLGQTEMELSVRITAVEQRLLRETDAEELSRLETEKRNSLKENFIERNQRELLMLVNPWNAVPLDLEPEITEIGDGMELDGRCAGALEKMLSDCRKAGGFPVPVSAYRTQEYQQELFQNKVERVIAGGTPPEAAEAKAAQSVAVPGTSEHQLGLAVDIVDELYPELDWQQQWTGTQRWLMEHCAEYGFILRYPPDTGEITGIIFEPWHYRYVGITAAAEITELGVTLEEYLDKM